MNLGLLTPEITLVLFALVTILIGLFDKRYVVAATVSIVGLLSSIIFSVGIWIASGQSSLNGMLAVDSFALFLNVLFAVIAILVILFANDYNSKIAHSANEFAALVLISTAGMMLMASASELIFVYIAVEVTSISLYILVGFLKDAKSTEASLKYLLLGAVASAVLLYGMALVFGYTGKTQLNDIALTLHQTSASVLLASPGLILGIVLLIAGFGFKIAAVPFHMWVPDVYEGAPTPITAFLSVASKAAGFAVLVRVFYTAFGVPHWLGTGWGLTFATLAVVSMTVGNVLAIPQTNIKRLFGYSSIAQAGYLLVGLATVGVAPIDQTVGAQSILFFLASYALTNLAAFAAIIAITNKLGSDNIEDFSGMIKRSPWITVALTLGLISLIGMPPAAGFIAKFFIFSGAATHGLLWLVIIAVINSVISAYYYLRVVKVMWFGQPANDEKVPSSSALRVSLVLCSLGILFLGIVPGIIMNWAGIASKIFIF